MHRIFLKITKQNFKLAIYLICLTCFLPACDSKSIEKELGYNCNLAKDFKNLTNIKDAKLTFEVKIPENWKRELFVNNIESRLYAADTTKELNNTYIYDFGYYSGELKTDEEFQLNLHKEINSFGKSTILKKKNFKVKNKDAYFVSYKTEKEHLNSNSILLFLRNKNNSFYKLKVDVYGQNNKEQRFCEALSLLETTTLNQQ